MKSRQSKIASNISNTNKQNVKLKEVKEENSETVETSINDRKKKSFKFNNYNNIDNTTDLSTLKYGKFEFRNKIVYIGFYKELTGGIKLRHGIGKLLHPVFEESSKNTNNLNNSMLIKDNKVLSSYSPLKKNQISNNDNNTNATKLNKNKKFNQESYEGDWIDDKMYGFGVYKYCNGDIYEGEFVDNKHHGFGKYFFFDGSKYEGEWIQHKMHGSGVYTDIYGDMWYGEFRKGSYISKEQARLKEEKRIYNKAQHIKVCFMKSFIKQWEYLYSNIIVHINNKDKSNKSLSNINNKINSNAVVSTLKLSKKTNEDVNSMIDSIFGNNSNMGAIVNGPYPNSRSYSYYEYNELFEYINDLYNKHEECFTDRSSIYTDRTLNQGMQNLNIDNTSNIVINVPLNNTDVKFIDCRRILSPQLTENLSTGQVVEIMILNKDNKKNNYHVELTNNSNNTNKTKSNISVTNNKSKEKESSKLSTNVLNNKNNKKGITKSLLENSNIKIGFSYISEFNKWVIVHLDIDYN